MKNIAKDLEFILSGLHKNEKTPELDTEKIKKAIEICKKFHKGQVRDSGELYYTHPLEVAKILFDLKMDCDTIVTGLLHDTIEDTELKSEEISKLFGSKVANLVDGVTKITKISFKSDNVKQAENFRKLILALSKDIRVLVVKLADRLHNMRTL